MPIPTPTQTATVPATDQAAATGNLILRNDTILGVCEAIGRDFGFHPNWLRVPLAGGVLISPIASFGIYFALGFAVLLSRLIAPAPRQIAAPQAADSPAQRTAENTAEQELLAA